MNRYRGPTVGAPSKATATTQCQKCLKRGHYSYECKAVAQERPYVSRPSRTQQLLNPKLVPKLTSDIPQDLLRKKGVADEQLARLKEERGRKRERQSEDPESPSDSKRMRSGSSESVSTISTNRSQPPPPRHRSRESARRKATSRSLSVSQSPPRRAYRDSAFDKKRRRGSSVSSEGSDPAGLRRGDTQGSKELTTGRSTRRRYSEHSPPARGRIPRTESQSPDRGRRRLSNDRRRSNDFQRNDIRRSEHRPGANYHNNGFAAAQTTRQREPPKERSLSPFSKRLALTQAMNMR